MSANAIGINGLGRIGKLSYRQCCQGGHDVSLLNDPAMTPEKFAKFLSFDSVHGKFDKPVSACSDSIIVGESSAKFTSHAEPDQVPWGKHGVSVVLECSGRYTEPARAALHLRGGAKRVVISAPPKGKGAPLFVYGVNHTDYRPDQHTVVSTASCTTNALAPVAKVILDNFGIVAGTMVTVHAFTSDQRNVDGVHEDLRRARGVFNIIPTTTGAARAIGEVIPQLKGKLDGLAVRVPVPDGSIVHLNAYVEKDTTVEAVKEALTAASQGPLNGVLGVTSDEYVSSDILGSSYAGVVDLGLTQVVARRMVHVAVWYDNEMSYLSQMVRFARYMASQER